MEDNGFPLELENPMQEDEFFCDISLSSFTDSPFTTLDIALNGSTSPAATGHSRGAAYLPGGNHWNDAADRVISSSDSSRGGKPSTTSTGHVTSKYEACHADRFTYPKDTEPSVHYPRSLHQPSAAGETEDSYTALAFSVASAGKTSAFLGLRSAEEQEKKTADTSESPVSPRTRAPHLSDCTAEPPKLAREPRETENLQRSATGLSLQSPFSSPQNEAAAREEHVSPLKNDSSVCPGVEVQSGTTRDEVSPSTEVSSQNSIGKDHHTEVREGRRISTFKPESSQGEHLRSKEMALPGGGSGHGEDSPAQNRTTTLTSGEAEETTHRGVSTEDGMRHKGDKEEDMGGQERRQGDELFPHHEFNSAQHAADESALNADDGETGWTSFQSSPAVEADAGQRGVLSSPPLGGPSAPSAEQHDRPFSSSQLPPPCTPAVLSPGPGETRETHGDRGAPVAARSSSSVSSSAGEADVLRAVACKKLGLLRMKDWEDERQARSTAIARLVADLTAGLTSAVEQSIAVSSHTARYLRARSKADLDYARALKATGSGGGRGKNAQTRYGFLLQGNVSSNPSHRGTIPSPSNASSGSTMERISSTSHTNHRRSSISSLGPDHGTYAANREKNCLEATLRTANSTPAASHSLCSWTNSTAAEEDVHKRHTPSYSRGGLRRESLQETEGAGENLFKDRFVSHKETYALSNVRGRCMKRSFKGSEISKQRNSPFKQETAFGDSSTSIAPKDGVEDASRHWTPGSLYEDMTIDSANEFPREENAGGECLFSSAETCAFPHFGQGLGDSCCAIDGKKKQEGGLLPKTWNEQGGQHSRSSISSDVECTSSSRRGSISDQRSASTGSSGRSRRRWSSATTFLQHFSPLQLGRSPGERRHSLTITEESESHVSSITYTGPEKEKGHINSWSEDRRSAGGSRRKSEEDSHTSHSFSKRGTLWSLHDDKKQSSVRQEGKTEYVVAWPSAACSSSIDHMEGGHSFEKSQVKEKGRDGRRSSNGEPLEAHDDRGGRGKKEEEERATTADHPKVKKTHLQQSRGMFPELSSTSWFLALLEMHDQNAFQMETLGTFVHSELVQDHLQRLCVEYDRETNKYLENLKKHRVLAMKADEACRHAWNVYEQVFDDVSRATMSAAGCQHLVSLSCNKTNPVLRSSSHPEIGEDSSPAQSSSALSALGNSTGTTSSGGVNAGKKQQPQCCWLVERKYSYAARKAQKEEFEQVKALIISILELQILERWRHETMRHVLQSFLLKMQSCLSIILLTLGRVSDVFESSPFLSTSSSENEEENDLHPQSSSASSHSAFLGPSSLSSMSANAVDLLNQQHLSSRVMLTQKRRELLDQRCFFGNLSSSSSPSFTLFWKERKTSGRKGDGSLQFDSPNDREEEKERDHLSRRNRTAYARPIHTADLVDRAHFAAAPHAVVAPEPYDDVEEGGEGRSVSPHISRTERRKISKERGAEGEGEREERKCSSNDPGSTWREEERGEAEEGVFWGPCQGAGEGSRVDGDKDERHGHRPRVRRKDRKDYASVWSLLRRCALLPEDCDLLEKAGGERKSSKTGRSFEGVLPPCLRLPAVCQLAEQLRYPPLPPSQLVIHEGTVERQAGGASSITGGFASGFLQKWKGGYLVLTWDRYLHLFREEADVNEPDEKKACWSVYLAQAEVRKCQPRNQTGGGACIEVREKRKHFFSSRNSYVFRPSAPTRELDAWLADLEAATDDSRFFKAISTKTTEPEPAASRTSVGRLRHGTQQSRRSKVNPASNEKDVTTTVPPPPVPGFSNLLSSRESSLTATDCLDSCSDMISRGQSPVWETSSSAGGLWDAGRVAGRETQLKTGGRIFLEVNESHPSSRSSSSPGTAELSETRCSPHDDRVVSSGSSKRQGGSAHARPPMPVDINPFGDDFGD